MSLYRCVRLQPLLSVNSLRYMQAASVGGSAGSGSGRGGGSGGSIRDAGGKFGEIEAAREEEYIRKLAAAQLKDLKKNVEREVRYHEAQLKYHQEAIDRHKTRAAELDSEAKLNNH